MLNQVPGSDELARDIIMHERNNFIAWTQAIQAVDDNVYGAKIEQFGNATVILNRDFSSPIFNRVFQISWADRHHIPDILNFFNEHGVRPLFDISPYDIAPYTSGENILKVLADYGLYHGGFHQMLYAEPYDEIPDTAPYLRIEEVSPDSGYEEFMAIYEAYSGDGRAIALLVGHSQYTCYLAQIDGKPAALGLLHIANGVGSMATGVTLPEFRNKGCQTALLYRRMRDASLAGCHLVISQCQPGGSSQNNQLTVGLHISGTKVWWTSAQK